MKYTLIQHGETEIDVHVGQEKLRVSLINQGDQFSVASIRGGAYHYVMHLQTWGTGPKAIRAALARKDWRDSDHMGYIKTWADGIYLAKYTLSRQRDARQAIQDG